jgi:hypothetical protein
MEFGFSMIGFIIFILPMLINIIYVIFPPAHTDKKGVKNNPILEFIEQGSRVAFAIALCALVTTNELNDNSPLLLISIVFLVLYYIVWIRYFAGGRKVALLGTKFLFVPMPLVIFPVLYYLFASLWLNNYVATAIVIAFGISHNIISYQNLYAKE